MKPISIEMSCSIYLNKQTVYCYEFSNGLILPNGCDVMNNSDACVECCKRAVTLAEEKLASTLKKFPLQES